MPHGGAFPLAFTLPITDGGLHKLSIVVGDQEVGWLHLPIFVEEVISGVEQWLTEHGDTERVRRNLESFARLRPEGLAPFVKGAVIA